jgi:uncharacterized protein
MRVRRLVILAFATALFQGLQAQTVNRYYPSGRAPLLATKYVKLPFGAIKPLEWLNTQLNLQANGMTGHVDEFYAPLKTLSGLNLGLEYLFCYHEGLMATAYLSNNQALITKAKTAVDYFINSQTADGNFLGTTEAFDHVAICRGLVEYYEITKDSRVIPFLTNYFHYVNSAGLAGNTWSTDRRPEHAVVAYWLYNHTGDQIVLDAITKTCMTQLNGWRNNYQNYGFTDSTAKVTSYPEYVHNVNIGEAFKYALYYLQSKDSSYKAIYTKGLPEIDKYHGSVGGRFNADENYEGKQPTQGMETCGIAEMSYSMEKLFEAFGDIPVADRAEFLVLNCFAGCNTADMWGHQYDQQANQIKVSNETRPWNNNNSTSNLYGREPNYPCCLCNVHQTWPRYIEHMWMATQDNGVIASLYGPSQVTASVGSDSATVTVTETTEYPFDGKIGFKITVSKNDSFPICFRIPQWESGATVQIGTTTAAPSAGTVYAINRTWHTGDSVTVTFPMNLRSENRWNQSVSVMRGPLWYSLKIGETWTKQSSSSNYMGSSDWAISPTTAWNVGLKIDPANPNGSFTVVRNAISNAPFAAKGEQIYLPGATGFTTWTQDPPVVLKGQGRILTGWTTNAQYPGNASDPPKSPLASTVAGRDTSIELIPYGSARLRVTEFPWINIPVGVTTRSLTIKDPECMTATRSKNGKYLVPIRSPGRFDLVLRDLAGREIYHVNTEGPTSVAIERGTVHGGIYIAHLVSGNRKFDGKITIVP